MTLFWTGAKLLKHTLFEYLPLNKTLMWNLGKLRSFTELLHHEKTKQKYEIYNYVRGQKGGKSSRLGSWNQPLSNTELMMTSRQLWQYVQSVVQWLFTSTYLKHLSLTTILAATWILMLQPETQRCWSSDSKSEQVILQLQREVKPLCVCCVTAERQLCNSGSKMQNSRTNTANQSSGLLNVGTWWCQRPTAL